MTNLKRLQLYIPIEAKEQLEQMAEELTLSQNHLVIMALHSLTIKYEETHSNVLSDLLHHTNTSNKTVSDENKRLQLYLSQNLKDSLAKMSEELNLSQNYLTQRAIISLLNKYKKMKNGIFKDLLTPDYKDITGEPDIVIQKENTSIALNVKVKSTKKSQCSKEKASEVQ